MAKVICKLPNAAELINGVKFTADRGEMVSDDMPEEVAANFATIPGYTLVGSKPDDSTGPDGKSSKSGKAG